MLVQPYTDVIYNPWAPICSENEPKSDSDFISLFLSALTCICYHCKKISHMKWLWCIYMQVILKLTFLFFPIFFFFFSLFAVCLKVWYIPCICFPYMSWPISVVCFSPLSHASAHDTCVYWQCIFLSTPSFIYRWGITFSHLIRSMAKNLCPLNWRYFIPKISTACFINFLSVNSTIYKYIGVTCALTEYNEARLDAFDMCCQRKILLVVWSQHITNSSIRSRTKQPQLTAVIRKCRLQWFGHWQRMNIGLHPNKLYHWKPCHRKWRPGQPKTWWEIIQKYISKMDLGWTVKEAEVAARERIMWGHLSSQAVSAVMHNAVHS